MAQWTVKGKRSNFFDDPAIDSVVSMLLALSSEVWSLRERVFVIEKVADEQGLNMAAAVEAYKLDPEEQQTLSDQRQDFIQRIMFVLQEEIDQLKSERD
jgi:hypothetical protein